MQGKGWREGDLDGAGCVVDGVGGREVAGTSAHSHSERLDFGIRGVLFRGPG